MYIPKLSPSAVAGIQLPLSERQSMTNHTPCDSAVKPPIGEKHNNCPPKMEIVLKGFKATAASFSTGRPDQSARRRVGECVPKRKDLLHDSALAFSRYLTELGVSQREFCAELKLPARTFNTWIANRSEQGAVGHTGRGPINLLKQLLVKAHMPDDVREKIEDVVFYVDRYLRKK